MENEKKILIKFILYFLFGFIIIFYGITHKVVPTVFADTVNVGYVTDKTVILYENNNAQAMISLPVNNTLNQYLYNILVIQLNNQTISKDYTYMLELYLPEGKLKNINNVYVVGGNNNGTTCQTIGLDNSNTSYPKIYFKCPVNLSSLTIGLNNDSPATSTESITTSSNFRWSYSYLIYYTEDDDIDLSPIIGNATNNTNNIINNNNNNTQNIISNNDENTQKIIDSNKENFQTCIKNYFPYPYLFSNQTLNGITFTINSDKSITVSGTATSTFFQNIARLTPNEYFTENIGSPTTCQNGYCLSDTRYIGYTNNSGSIWFYFASGRTYNYTLKPMLTKGSIPNEYIEPQEENCTNKLDVQNETSKGILGKIGDLFNTLFSNEDADISGLNNMVGWLPPGPVDSIINLPLSFFNALTNTLSGTCQDVSLTLPFVNQTLVLPCFDAYMTRYLTNFGTFWTLVGSIVSIFILYNYLLALYKWVDDTLTFRENNLPGYYGDNWGGGA